MSDRPALGVVELSSIARGVLCADAMLKRADVALLQSRPVSPGKHVIVVAGGEEEVAQAMRAGVETAAGALVDRLYLPGAHAQLAPAVAGERCAAIAGAIAVVEIATVATTILAADAACKAADVALMEMRLAMGLGGKGFFVLTGDLFQVEAAVAAAASAIEPTLLVGREIVANPHEDFAAGLLR